MYNFFLVSDTCSVDQTQDRSGPRLQEEVKKVFANAVFLRAIVPDEKDLIKDKLREFCSAGCDVIFTTGKLLD